MTCSIIWKKKQVILSFTSRGYTPYAVTGVLSDMSPYGCSTSSVPVPCNFDRRFLVVVPIQPVHAPHIYLCPAPRLHRAMWMYHPQFLLHQSRGKGGWVIEHSQGHASQRTPVTAQEVTSLLWMLNFRCLQRYPKNMGGSDWSPTEKRTDLPTSII